MSVQDNATFGEAARRTLLRSKALRTWLSFMHGRAAVLALTAATTDNSCLHFVPAPADPGYYAGDDSEGDKDPMQCCFPDKEAYQHIRAVPLEAGGASFHTHRIIHWGSSGRAAAEVRIPAFCFAAALDRAVACWLMCRRLMPGAATNLHVVLLL